MATKESCPDNGQLAGRDCDSTLPVDPFTALKPHFGMLLGVQDFQTIDAYHRGKQWLHSGWLHRDGTVWGLKISLDVEHDEIRVAPGLAVDALGRELYLPKPVCLNVPAWVERHRDDEEFRDIFEEVGETAVRFSVHAVIRFRACPARQVPALMEPCEGGAATTAYSRLLETVEVRLRPGLAPAVGGAGRERPYHRLRLLFALDAPIEEEGAVTADDQLVIDERERIQGLPAGEQPAEYLLAFRRFAALDEMDLHPAAAGEGEFVSLFPALEPAPLVLADLTDLTVDGQKLQSGSVDNQVRDVHVATATIQELLCGPLFGLPDSGGGGSFVASSRAAADAGGPRIEQRSVASDGKTLDFSLSVGELLKRSVKEEQSVFVSSYGVNSGWRRETIADIRFAGDTVKISLKRKEALRAELLRLVVKGTGPTPVLGVNRVPLAGAAGGPPGTAHQGNDFVFVLKQGE